MQCGSEKVLLSSASAENLRLGNPKMLGATTVTIHVYVSDAELDARYEAAKAAGADVAAPPHVTKSGFRGFFISDLEGHLWAFSSFRP
jgi:uncharacterized glyoxalase superfamily protein PhnB